MVKIFEEIEDTLGNLKYQLSTMKKPSSKIEKTNYLKLKQDLDRYQKLYTKMKPKSNREREDFFDF